MSQPAAYSLPALRNSIKKTAAAAAASVTKKLDAQTGSIVSKQDEEEL